MRHLNFIWSSMRYKSRSSRLLTKDTFRCCHSYVDSIAKGYDPAIQEEIVRDRWTTRESKIKTLEVVDCNKPVFRMILPPPNVTGKLHLGHALTVAIQDTIVRWKMMTGSTVQWIPGFDHAGIATQSVVLRKINKSQSSGLKNSVMDVPPIIDPSELQKQLKDFAEVSRENISAQLQRMGAMLDWNSTYYTLNDSHSSIVEEAFITLFDAGSIRRGYGMVNWSCALNTTISDIECVAAEFEGKITLRVPGHKQLVEFGCLYFINYQLENSDETITIATSRPETIFGDVAIAVNPDDSRYTKHIGCKVINPLTGKSIPVIADSRVKMEFGSGALKITPAHDKADFQIGVDHNLEIVDILTQDGHLNEKCGNLAGLGRFAGRKAVLKRLTEAGVVVDTRDYRGSVDLCSRTGDVIEPRILPHWFFKTRWLSDKITSYIENNELNIQPDDQRTLMLARLDDAHDWCLSRQIKWGHPIPAYYHADHPNVWVVALDKKSARQKLEKKLSIEIPNENQIRQDTDVLDTWFSSALIPLAVSGWPEIDSKHFQELSLMETGVDILTSWVWRMIMLNLALVERLPFRHVVLHGIVTDPYGRKMSKSLGNVIDPMHVINGLKFSDMLVDAETSFNNGELDQNEYKLRVDGIKKHYSEGFPVCGADALRFALLSQDIFKRHLKLDLVYLKNCKHFMNKLWQAMRFYFIHADKGINHPTEITKPDLKLSHSLADIWILACLHEFNKIMEESVASCRFYECTEAVRRFFYSQFCDVYIELVKSDFKDDMHVENHILTMRYIFGTGLKLIHPFLPYISEAMWSHITENKKGFIMDAQFPKSEETIEFKNEKLLQLMKNGLKIASEIRSLKVKTGVPKKTVAVIYAEINPKDPELDQVAHTIETLSYSEVLLEAPPRSKQVNISHMIELENGKSCLLSVLKEESKVH